MNSRADPHCPSCRGAGTLIEGEKIDENGDYWCHITDCWCIQEIRECEKISRKMSIEMENKAKSYFPIIVEYESKEGELKRKVCFSPESLPKEPFMVIKTGAKEEDWE